MKIGLAVNGMDKYATPKFVQPKGCYRSMECCLGCQSALHLKGEERLPLACDMCRYELCPIYDFATWTQSTPSELSSIPKAILLW